MRKNSITVITTKDTYPPPLWGRIKVGVKQIISSPHPNLPPSATKRGEIRPQSVLGRIAPMLYGEQGEKENLPFQH